mmetsp:Transcript_51796/g.150409  ORF Transcript_51796/g.150409 Transcript_51796/m.150409 type:complete len:218 (+) Transcript_51796:2678-3331(+)
MCSQSARRTVAAAFSATIEATEAAPVSSGRSPASSALLALPPLAAPCFSARAGATSGDTAAGRDLAGRTGLGAAGTTGMGTVRGTGTASRSFPITRSAAGGSYGCHGSANTFSNSRTQLGRSSSNLSTQFLRARHRDGADWMVRQAWSAYQYQPPDFSHQPHSDSMFAGMEIQKAIHHGNSRPRRQARLAPARVPVRSAVRAARARVWGTCRVRRAR